MENDIELYQYGLNLKGLTEETIHPLVRDKYKMFIRLLIERNPTADLETLKVASRYPFLHLFRYPTSDIPLVKIE